MPYDLMLSENGDLVFSASRDFQGVGGKAQIEQSIRTRLKIPRGSWDYDEDGTLGSNLQSLVNTHPDEIVLRAGVFVREALRGLTDIEVDDVGASVVKDSLEITVFYHLVGSGDELDQQSIDELSFTIPQGG